jgi:hypothetical protein
MKHRVQLLLTIVVAVCALNGAVTAADTSAPSVDPSVSQLETFGVWKYVDRNGRFWLIVTNECSPEHCFGRAYLQWLEAVAGADGRYQQTVVAESVRIEELGDFAVVQFIAAGVGSVPNRVGIKAANTYTREQRRFCITPTVLGKYSAREGACPPAA